MVESCGAQKAGRQVSPGENVINWSHQAWSTENGLPQNSIHQVLQTKNGYIWLATEDGLARFDGINFRVFNEQTDSAFASNDIHCLAQDSTGGLWIGTADGLVKYSGSAFRRFSTADGLPSNTITSLAVADDGSLFVLTERGLARFDGRSFSVLPSVPSAITRLRNGSILFASPEGIFRYERGNIRALASAQGFAHKFPKETIDEIGELADHTIWLRTRSSILLLGSGQPRILRTGRSGGFPGNRFEAFLQDSRGILWIGTNKGLVSLNSSNEQPELQTTIGSDAVLCLFEDKEGNLWIGTDTDGIHILRQQKFRTLPEFSEHAITAITQGADGAAWAGTNGDGLDCWRAGESHHFSTNNGLASDVILALAADARGSVWVGTPDGLNQIDGRTIRTYTSANGLPDDFIRSLLVDDDGSLWIGTRRGLAHWQNNRFTVLTSANGLKSDLIGVLLKSRSHALWIGTLRGLARLQNGAINNGAMKDGEIVNYTTKEGLSADIVTSLLEDSGGTLWIGTDGHGLSRSIPGGFAPEPARGLPTRVNAILEDDRGYLWLSSNHGITRVSEAALESCGQSPDCYLHVNSYGVPDGMPSEETPAIGHPTAWKAASGSLWFATRKGVAVADPDRFPENHIAPPVVIEGFTVDDSQVALGPQKLTIPPGHNRFTFEYAGLSYAAPAKVRYRYTLEGFEKQWTSAGTRRTAYYTNLAPGHYLFRVQAANNDGVWNTAGAQVAFDVQPPFYRKLWFLLLLLLLCGTLFTAVITLLYRLRVRRLQAQFDAVLAERNRIAREIHDTLAQGFAGVSMQLELTAQLLAKSQVSAAHEQIDRTRSFVREGLAEARRTIRELRTSTAQDSLPVRLTRLAEQAPTQALTVQVKIGGVYRPLAPALESEVLRIAQESLTNVDRHAGATRVSVDLRYDSNRLTLTITDDGQGFEGSDTSLLEKGHFGLQGMRERAAQIGARLIIESSPGKGAKIMLDVPAAGEPRRFRIGLRRNG